MKSLNQCNFIGRLGQDPEVKHMPNGDAVANISIAVSDDYTDKQSGQKVEQTEWVRIVAFRRLAEIIGEYLQKGSLVFISGKMTTRKWQDQNGQDRYSTEIVAQNMQMLDSRLDQESGASAGAGYSQNTGINQGSNQENPNGTQQSNLGKAAQAPQQKPAPNFNDFDDDIPF